MIELKHGQVRSDDSGGDFVVSASFTIVSDRLSVLEVNQSWQRIDSQLVGHFLRRRFDELDAVSFSIVVDVLKPI